MTAGVPELTHPVNRCAAQLAALLDEVAGVEPIYMTVDDKAAALRALARDEERLHELTLRVLAAADDVALEAGARSAGAWLAHETRCGREQGAAAQRLAEALGSRCLLVGDALAEGRVNRYQAAVIVNALDALPEDLEPEVRIKAEAHLVDEAAHFGPSELRVLGRGVLEVVAPDVATEEERRRHEAEERAARKDTRLTMRVRGDGSTDIRIRVPEQVAARLKVYLESMTSPRRHDRDPEGAGIDLGDVARLPYGRRLGEAFCALLERLPSKVLPQHGGTATTVMVTIKLDDLLSGLGVATLGSGEVITAGEARRLACNADLMPLVLGGPSEVLDLGRIARLYSASQRKAMAVRDGHCRAEGCTIPAAWCEAHHLHPWSLGGLTDLADGVLLCSHHHHLAHDDRYDASRLPNGDVRFARRT
ncbi:HNH endonuclease signature motif containing protein [Nocardioides sp. LS1]|uniref:HNH endonuclease signature motif containing protein n=1 Tax=Nocardioides sp. LS1 TaxID=1027620 RepID=UPI000F6202C3|nr:HNH endonuclease signature motif containing protein [Nocardioides sp. LS1]GCD91462.1 HNH endonuclease [Nocardioides sp. LS1]